VTEHYDVIIIGSGAGGGTLAHTLAASGKSILILERGDFLPREMDNWDPEPVFIHGKYISKDTWYDADGKAFQPQVHYNVGGATKLYGAALYRLRPQDFGEVRHVDGVSPAWPLSYDDFEPWYTKAEWLYQVHGNVGEDPADGHHSKPYPWPAVSHEPRIQQLSDELAAGGYHPFHAPCGILLDEADRAKSTCIRCTWCDGYPCLVHAKADAETIAVRPLLGLPNVTLLVDAEVTRLETDPAGASVTRVVVSRAGNQESYEGDIVVVSAGAANSAKLLLNSANDRHPNGLANGSDQVGRNYMFHNCRAVVALAKEPNETVFQKTVGLNDFYFGAKDYDWPVGNIQMIGKSNAEAMKGEEPKLTKLAPHFSLAEVAKHALDFWLTTEDVPKPDNRVTVDKSGDVHLAYRSNNDQEADRLYHELKELLNRVGLAQHHVLDKNFYMHMDVSVAGVAHQAGTCRFGTDPATSALDSNCKAHQLDNLYVVDTSFFPSIGAVNPALTAMANAIRVGEHLAERLK
jgi:choline dehydrogenase-like flavoprotein